MYHLTLSKDERRAIDFVGCRYANGNDLFRVLLDCIPADKEWDDFGMITFEIEEHKAWDICSLAAEDDYQFPLFADNLKNKFLDLVSVVV